MLIAIRTLTRLCAFVVVLAGDKGWRQFGDNKMEMDQDGLANQKRAVYLQVIPATLLPLREKGFKLAPAGEEQVAGKPAVGLKVTPPDGKDFTLFALVEGVVKYEWKNNKKKQVSVYPAATA